MSDYMVDQTTGRETARYSALAATFHWLSAALVLAQIYVGLKFSDLPRGPERMELFGWHKIIGVTILVVALLRLAQRLVNPPPPYPSDTPKWDRFAAVWTHRIFYALLVIIPVTGLSAISKPGQSTVEIAPGLSLPAIPLGKEMGDVHEILAFAMIGLLFLHVAGALYHQFRKDGAAGRMPPFSRG